MKNASSDYLMVSKTNDVMIAGSVYFYDPYARSESEKVKMHYREIPFTLVHPIIQRDIYGPELEGVQDNDEYYCYLLYREDKDLSDSDEKNLIETFKTCLMAAFKRKHPNCEDAFWIHLDADRFTVSTLNETVLILVTRMEEGETDEEDNTMVEEKETTAD